MFGLTALETRLAAYGFVLAAICGILLYTHHEGYEACRAPQKAAEKAQVEKDLADAKGTIHDLQTRLAAIPAPQPAPHVLLCPSRSVRAGSATPGAQSDVATPLGNSPSGMPSGAAGIDIGSQLQNLREASQVIAVYRDETIDWALKQAH